MPDGPRRDRAAIIQLTRKGSIVDNDAAGRGGTVMAAVDGTGVAHEGRRAARQYRHHRP